MNLEKRLQAAVQSFWTGRAQDLERQKLSGNVDAGTRGAVTAGTQMGALETLVTDILCEAGLEKAHVKTRSSLELPGYYRGEKKWDLIVVSEDQLVLAMEFKSQAGPSFGNN
ncbi:MAG: restriction endonuclease, partial [Acidobacteria bacterium]|nr:restriction endonuclease [Acidobacteriota bacterium]